MGSAFILWKVWSCLLFQRKSWHQVCLLLLCFFFLRLPLFILMSQDLSLVEELNNCATQSCIIWLSLRGLCALLWSFVVTSARHHDWPSKCVSREFTSGPHMYIASPHLLSSLSSYLSCISLLTCFVENLWPIFRLMSNPEIQLFAHNIWE